MSWICSRCETVNTDTFDVCEVCDTNKSPKDTLPFGSITTSSISKFNNRLTNYWIIGFVVLLACMCFVFTSLAIVSVSILIQNIQF